MKKDKSSIRITTSGRGRTIHATGAAAQSFFEAMRQAHCPHKEFEYRGSGDFEYCKECGMERPRP